MQILTPSGYKAPVMLANGDEVCAFDALTGAPITNLVENVDFVNYAEWCRWWSASDCEVPSFDWICVNGSSYLFREQSIWRNGTHVCHARDLVIGDQIYDDHDQPVTITSIDVKEDRSREWYRFDISGDHSYIVDGTTAHNASRNWVGGTGSITPSNTTNWAASSGGTGGQSVPGSADQAILDGSSGGGTVTMNFGGTWTLQSLSMGSYTGTFDNSVNNNNITCSAAGNSFNLSGTATRTITLGSPTYTITSGSGTWQFGTINNATFTGSSATIAFTNSAGGTFQGGDRTYGGLTLGPSSGGGVFSISGTNTFAAVTVTAPCWIEFASSQTFSGVVNLVGSSGSIISLIPNGTNSQKTLAFTAGSALQWCAIRGMNMTGSPSITNSFDLGNNGGASIGAPSGGSTALYGMVG